MNKFASISITSIIFFSSMSASAAPVLWTDWLSSATSSSASGQIVSGATTVAVDYSGTGSHSFVQTGSGTNYWTGGAYTNGSVDNAPPASELIALNQGGTVTITFSQTVINPFIGLISWNNNTVDFGTPISIDSFGAGFWGNGTPIVNGTGTGFSGSGEVHGVLAFSGAYDSITFSHTSENWHGFTVGVSGVSAVPVPAAAWLFASGLLGLIGVANRRAKT